jgi:hypothetical protein
LVQSKGTLDGKKRNVETIINVYNYKHCNYSLKGKKRAMEIFSLIISLVMVNLAMWLIESKLV